MNRFSSCRSFEKVLYILSVLEASVTHISHQVHRQPNVELLLPAGIAAPFHDRGRVDDSLVRFDRVDRSRLQIVALEGNVGARFHFDARLLLVGALGAILVPFAELLADVHLREVDRLLDLDRHLEQIRYALPRKYHILSYVSAVDDFQFDIVT